MSQSFGSLGWGTVRKYFKILYMTTIWPSTFLKSSKSNERRDWPVQLLGWTVTGAWVVDPQHWLVGSLGTLQCTPTSSLWTQFEMFHPRNWHWSSDRSVPSQTTSSIQIGPVPTPYVSFAEMDLPPSLEYQNKMIKHYCTYYNK